MTDKPKKKLAKGMKPYKPGQSGNPRGRPKGAKGLAKYLRKQLGDDLFKVADEMIKILLGKSQYGTSNRDVMTAATWLTDRAVGKAEERVIINSNAEVGRTGAAVSRLSDSDLAKLDILVAKMDSDEIDPDAPAFEPGELH